MVERQDFYSDDEYEHAKQVEAQEEDYNRQRQQEEEDYSNRMRRLEQ